MVFSKEHKRISGIGGIRLQVFSSEEMDAIHFASLHLLGNVGIKVENEEAAQIYGDNGCSVRNCGEYWLVKLPQNLVENCIRSAPSKVMAWGRDRHHDFVLEPNRVGFMPMGECLNVIDPRTREYRPAVKKDIIHWIKAIDALDGLDICPNPALCSDVPGKTAMLHSLEAMLAHTRKPVSLTTLGGAETEAHTHLTAGVAQEQSGPDAENVGQAVVDAHADEDHAGGRSTPTLDGRQLVVGLGDPAGAESDRHGKDQHRQAGRHSEGSRKKKAGAVLHSHGNKAAEEPTCGDGTERQRKQDPQHSRAPQPKRLGAALCPFANHRR